MSQSKLREFWVDPRPYDEDHENGVHDAIKKHPRQGPLQWQESLIHVIEHSAYAELKAQNEKLVEALKFYAGSKDSIFEIIDEGRDWAPDNVIYESDLREGGKMDQPLGQLAREVLKELGEEL